jgi:hypothetical protein
MLAPPTDRDATVDVVIEAAGVTLVTAAGPGHPPAGAGTMSSWCRCPFRPLTLIVISTYGFVAECVAWQIVIFPAAAAAAGAAAIFGFGCVAGGECVTGFAGFAGFADFAGFAELAGFAGFADFAGFAELAGFAAVAACSGFSELPAVSGPFSCTVAWAAAASSAADG